MPAEIQSKFASIGGEFIGSIDELQDKILNLKAFIFDWDGVFNDGVKTGSGGSPFSEIDSMGLNMLRFGYYLKFGFIPDIYVVTGENNPPALHLSRREHFKATYLKAKVKTEALAHIKSTNDISNGAVAFMFDDILDIGLAADVGLGFYVSRSANPLLNEYVATKGLAAYRTANTGASNAVREVCELCLGVLGNYSEVVDHRVANSPVYQDYLRLRNTPTTTFFKFDSDQFEEFTVD